jgi:hypothetical protein
MTLSNSPAASSKSPWPPASSAEGSSRSQEISLIIASFQFPPKASTIFDNMPHPVPIETQYWELPRPIRTVAVIGAGASGVSHKVSSADCQLPIARRLRDAGKQVRLYERNSYPGGIWKYQEAKAATPQLPALDPSQVDYQPDLVSRSCDQANSRTRSTHRCRKRCSEGKTPMRRSTQWRCPLPLLVLHTLRSKTTSLRL